MKSLATVVGIACVIIGVADIAFSQRSVDCPYFCAQVYQPVCGSNGKTYGNECELQGEAECNDPSVYKVADGPCSSDGGSSSSDPCADVECDVLPCPEDLQHTYPGNCCPECPQDWGVEPCVLRGDCTLMPPTPAEFCPLACLEIYHPVCGSDGKTYDNDCKLTSQSECYDASLYKVSDGVCSNPVTQPAEELWCPQKYPDDANASVAGGCNRNEDCIPGFGCCWVEDCPYGLCCVELLKEPADCLDVDYSLYGEKLSLRHGESQQGGFETCPSTCYCENGRILCFVPQCLAPGITFGSLFRFLSPCLALIICLAMLCIIQKAWRHHRQVRNQHTPETPGSQVDKPPAYGEAVKMQHPSPTVVTIAGNTPPSYEQAIKMA